MSADPLYQPLGLAPAGSPRRSPGRMVWAVPALIVLVGAGAAGLVLHRGAAGGEVAVAVAPIEVATATPSKPANAPAAPATGGPSITEVGPAAAPAPSSGTSIEVQNGVKIVRFSPAASAAAVAIPVGETHALKPAPDPRVSETTRWGTLPRLGSNGLRPADVYGRPASPGPGPLVAVLLDGMGADQAATANAARLLPAAVSFAFAPETADAAAQVAETRRVGHEVFMALTAAPPETDAAPESGETLHRRMARFTGYAGVAFEAGAPPDATALHDVAARGLAVVTAPAAGPAGPEGIAADVVIDGASGHAAVAAAFARLSGLAHTSGRVLVRITHAGLVVDDIAALNVKLKSDGVTLVPVTALTARTAVAAGK